MRASAAGCAPTDRARQSLCLRTALLNAALGAATLLVCAIIVLLGRLGNAGLRRGELAPAAP